MYLESQTIDENRESLEHLPNWDGSNYNLHLLFPTLMRNYVNEYRLFVTIFGVVPNKITEKMIDIEKARQWFLKNYGSQVVDSFFNKVPINESKEAVFDDCIYVLSPDFMVYFDTQQETVRYLFKKTKTDFVNDLVAKINLFRIDETNLESKIYLLVSKKYGLDIEGFTLNKPSLELVDNYNEDFLHVHETIVGRLSKQNDKGMVLLHGKPGTGKTTYIRYLTSLIGKKVIFLPPNMTDQITNPGLISLLIENPNSVLVIEDAEEVILERTQHGTAGVSALLNLTDGLLAECLHVQIICSFNTELAKIDSALLRKGRLIASYRFEPLAAEKAQNLSAKLGFNSHIAEPMRLTDVYNQNETSTHYKPKNSIGFLTN
jgi:hypothetical protein